MASKYGTTLLNPPMVVTGYTPLKNLVDVPPPPLHYFTAIIEGEWFIFDSVHHGKGGYNIHGDAEITNYVHILIANKPLLSVLTVRPAHARYDFAYGDFGKDSPDTAITRSEAKGLRYMEAMTIAANYILLFQKLHTCNETRRVVGDWHYEYYTPTGKLLTRKFKVTEEYILDEENIEETDW